MLDSSLASLCACFKRDYASFVVRSFSTEPLSYFTCSSAHRHAPYPCDARIAASSYSGLHESRLARIAASGALLQHAARSAIAILCETLSAVPSEAQRPAKRKALRSATLCDARPEGQKA